MKRRGFIQGLIGALPGAVVALRAPAALPAPLTPPSVIGRGSVTAGSMAHIACGRDGQVLRRTGAALAFGAIDLADCDAVPHLLLPR